MELIQQTKTKFLKKKGIIIYAYYKFYTYNLE